MVDARYISTNKPKVKTSVSIYSRDIYLHILFYLCMSFAKLGSVYSLVSQQEGCHLPELLQIPSLTVLPELLWAVCWLVMPILGKGPPKESSMPVVCRLLAQHMLFAMGNDPCHPHCFWVSQSVLNFQHCTFMTSSLLYSGCKLLQVCPS
jgi:hypothetical protein